jgi:hypothetical protein
MRWLVALYGVPVNSPRPTFSDGRSSTPANVRDEARRIGVAARDDGRPGVAAEIPTLATFVTSRAHIAEASNGIIAHIRNHNKANEGETLQSESADGGRTWSIPHAIGVWGLPSHLVRLKDGRLLMSYGYRRAPFGNQARSSEDNGATWSQPMVISADGDAGDLGYPSTVQLDDASLVTIWYEPSGNPARCLRQELAHQIVTPGNGDCRPGSSQKECNPSGTS